MSWYQFKLGFIEKLDYFFEMRITKLILVFLILRCCLWFLKRMINKRFGNFFDEKRENTFKNMLYSIASFGSMVLFIFYALNLFINNFGNLVLGASVIGASLAIGARSVVKDMIIGIINLTEQQFNIGDEVTINSKEQGKVEEITLRLVKIRVANGELLSIPYGEIKTVHNSHKEKLRINQKIRVKLSEEPEIVLEKLNKFCDMLNKMYSSYLLRDEENNIIEPYRIIGLTEFNVNGLGHEFSLYATIDPKDAFEAKCMVKLQLSQFCFQENIMLSELPVQYTIDTFDKQPV
ncbi:mechanosensitive ion channel family protein [Bacillus bombysepticus]|uniref:mechanosensitive ion channel family protein n=1 Tax=Bacillus bombysepticus TaxID=658666 RepID=UPI0030183EDA